MICPKCRKKYLNGITQCPDCGSQLIALMGEADAPVDEDFDNISSLEVVFGDENNVEDNEQLEEEYETFEELEPEEEAFELLEDEADDDQLQAELDEEPLYVEQEEYLEQPEYSETFEQEQADDDDVKIFISSSDEDFVAKDPEYFEDYSQDDEQENYEVEFSEEYLQEEEAKLNEVHIGSATVYKASDNRERKKAEAVSQEADELSEKGTNAITMVIFALAVLMIIASVICFVLGNTTELTEMQIDNIFLSGFNMLK